MIGPGFDLGAALVTATTRGRAVIETTASPDFIAEGATLMGRVPSAEDLTDSAMAYLFRSAVELHYVSRRDGATDAQADQVRDAYIEGAHAALLSLGGGLQ